jgi:exopolysaccharide production protein ExoZ
VNTNKIFDIQSRATVNEHRLTIASAQDFGPGTLSERGTSKLDSIQALRGIAILLVLIAHIGAFEKVYGGGYLPPHLAFGNLGVDLFFCISGFIMVTITENREHHETRSGAFYWKRFVRIYPLYWVVTTVTLFAWRFIRPPEYVFVASKDLLPYYLKSLLLVPITPCPVINQGWSLVNEIYFYIVFGFFLLFSRRILPQLLFLWAVWVTAGRTLLFLYPEQFGIAFFKVIADRLTIEFIGGCTIALILQKKLNYPATVLLAAGILLTCVTIAMNPVKEHFVRLAWFGIPSALIFFSCVAGEMRHGWHFPGWLISLGDISYSLYLTHVLSFVLIGVCWAHFVRNANVPLSLVLSAILTVGAISIGFLCYRYVEQPLLRTFRRRLSGSRKRRRAGLRR